MKVNRKYLKESLNEDLFDIPRDIADSICKYLDSKNFYNYELVDYDSYPMNTSKITFEVDGDWKHDHWRFKDLVYDWSFDNNKSIHKMESELVRDDGSDSYASDYFIYVTENEDSLNALKSMSKLFSEEYEDDVDNWQYLDTDQDYKPQKDYFADIETTDDDGPYYKLCSYSSYPSAGINGDSFDTYEIVKAFDAKDAQEKFIDLLDDEDKEVLRYFNNDFRAFMRDRNLYIDDATKKEYDSFHGLGEEPGELSRRFKKYLNKEESLSEDLGLDPWYGKYVPIDIGGSKGTPRKVYFYFDSTDFDEAEEEFFDIIPEPYVKAKLYGRASEGSLVKDGWKNINESLKEEFITAQDVEEARRVLKNPKKLSLEQIKNLQNLIKKYKEQESSNKSLKNESLNEASYGGAYDIEDDMFFTKEELVEFAGDIAEEFSKLTGHSNCDVDNVYMENDPLALNVDIYDPKDEVSHSAYTRIDMRKIRKPSDIYKYMDRILKQLEDSFHEYHENDFEDAE